MEKLPWRDVRSELRAGRKVVNTEFSIPASSLPEIDNGIFRDCAIQIGLDGNPGSSPWRVQGVQIINTLLVLPVCEPQASFGVLLDQCSLQKDSRIEIGQNALLVAQRTNITDGSLLTGRGKICIQQDSNLDGAVFGSKLEEVSVLKSTATNCPSLGSSSRSLFLQSLLCDELHLGREGVAEQHVNITSTTKIGVLRFCPESKIRFECPGFRADKILCEGSVHFSGDFRAQTEKVSVQALSVVGGSTVFEFDGNAEAMEVWELSAQNASIRLHSKSGNLCAEWGDTSLIAGTSLSLSSGTLCARITKIADSTIESSDMTKSSFAGAQLESAAFVGCDFSESDFRRANFNKVDFTEVKLPGANFLGASVSGRLSFENSILEGATSDRYFLESLREFGGGLSIGSVMGMNVIDLYSEIQERFSGFLRLVHFVSIGLFTFPFIIFVVDNAWVAPILSLGDGGGVISLLEGLWKYYCLGPEWHEGNSSLIGVRFWLNNIALMAVVVRLILLSGSIKLEIQNKSAVVMPTVSAEDSALLGISWRRMLILEKNLRIYLLIIAAAKFLEFVAVTKIPA